MLEARPAAVILTPAGILTVKDKHEIHIRNAIENIEKRSDKNDEQKAAGIEIVKQGKYSLAGGGFAPGEKDPRDTIIRECWEELKLTVEGDNMQELGEIVGSNRRHIIYLVRATGVIALDPEDTIAGIGFLNQKNIFPLDKKNAHDFFQSHLVVLHSRYFGGQPREEREARLIQFVSNIRVSEVLIQQWFEDEKRIETYRGKIRRHPRLIETSPNLTIVDANGKPLPPRPISNLTKSAAAIFIPRSTNTTPGLAKAHPHHKKSPSDPKMRAVKVPPPADQLASPDQSDALDQDNPNESGERTPIGLENSGIMSSPASRVHPDRAHFAFGTDVDFVIEQKSPALKNPR